MNSHICNESDPPLLSIVLNPRDVYYVRCILDSYQSAGEFQDDLDFQLVDDFINKLNAYEILIEE